MAENLITVKNLYKTFYGATALDGMDFSIDKGEIRCLIGENGCGKSTMIKIISGFYDYDKGEIFIDGKQYKKITPIESMKAGIQVIYQDFSLFDNMTIAENIMMYQVVQEKRRIIHKAEMRKRAQETVSRIGFDINIDKYVHELNVAQKQMVAICRALVQDAVLLIMDEPTTALTTIEVENLFRVTKELKSKGVSILFVSHKLDEVFKISDSLTVMRNGKKVYESNDLNISKEELIYKITGKHIDDVRFDYSTLNNVEETLYEVRGYELEPYFRDINFSLKKGEILGITGLLGSGRSELADALFGAMSVDKGTVVIEGNTYTAFKNLQKAINLGMAYVPEDRLTEGIHLEQKIAYNVVARIINNLKGKGGFLSSSKIKEQQKIGLSKISIHGLKLNNPAKSLSGGNQQKLVLVKWLVSNPKLLILNCPTVGVDIGAKSEIHNIIRDLAKKGIGIIVVSDDIPEIIQLCSRVLIIKNGTFVQERTIKDTTMEEIEELLGGAQDRKEVAG